MATSKDRRTFVFNIGWADDMEDLDNDARLKFFDAIIAYAKNGELPDNMTNMEMVIFKSIKRDIDLNNEKFEAIKQKRSEAGRKGGQAKQANATFAKQEEAKQANATFAKHNENVNEDVNEDVNVPLYNGGDIISPPTQEEIPENLSLEHQARDFIKFFNERAQGTSIPQVLKVTQSRVRNAGRMLHQWGRESMEEVVIKATAPNSCFATGELTIGFDWLMNEDNAIKVLEGNYDNTRTNQQGTGMGKQEARHLEQLRQLAGGDPERLAYLEATYTNR